MKRFIFLFLAMLLPLSNALARNHIITLSATSLSGGCQAMGITPQDISNIRMTLNLANVKDPAHGTPVLVSLSGVDLSGSGVLRFSEEGMNKLYAWDTDPTGLLVKLGGHNFRFTAISLESALYNRGYNGVLRIDNMHSTMDYHWCLIHLHEFIQ